MVNSGVFFLFLLEYGGQFWLMLAIWGNNFGGNLGPRGHFGPPGQKIPSGSMVGVVSGGAWVPTKRLLQFSEVRLRFVPPLTASGGLGAGNAVRVT